MTAPPRRRTRKVVREAVRATALAAFFLALHGVAEAAIRGNPAALALIATPFAFGAYAFTKHYREARR